MRFERWSPAEPGPGEPCPGQAPWQVAGTRACRSRSAGGRWQVPRSRALARAWRCHEPEGSGRATSRREEGHSHGRPDARAATVQPCVTSIRQSLVSRSGWPRSRGPLRAEPSLVPPCHPRTGAESSDQPTVARATHHSLRPRLCPRRRHPGRPAPEQGDTPVLSIRLKRGPGQSTAVWALTGCFHYAAF